MESNGRFSKAAADIHSVAFALREDSVAASPRAARNDAHNGASACTRRRAYPVGAPTPPTSGRLPGIGMHRERAFHRTGTGNQRGTPLGQQGLSAPNSESV